MCIVAHKYLSSWNEILDRPYLTNRLGPAIKYLANPIILL